MHISNIDVCTVFVVIIYCNMARYISMLFGQFCLNVDIFYILVCLHFGIYIHGSLFCRYIIIGIVFR